eukprot:GHVL01037362.1.p1 GENE.GHVL01037362.1~~GHVL01037362.1.p1  ORF type:complete len:1632 (-),score=171.38 GHVL01037362.1:2330-7225(-)
MGNNFLTLYINELNLPVNLIEIRFRENDLKGEIRGNWPNSLRTLALSSNNFEGSIESVTWPPNLEMLSISHNQIDGDISKWNLPDSLMYLYLQSNKLTGSLNSMRMPPTLNILLIDSNLISGSLCFKNMAETIKVISIARNELTGILPRVDWPSQLVAINLDENELTGNLQGISWPVWLEILRINSNSLSGELRDLNFPSSLKTFSASSNKFTGTLDNITWPNLISHINIERNQFDGNVENLIFPKYLKDLYLAGNMFVGDLKDFSLPSNLENFDASNNRISGNFDYFDWPPSLISINLCCNYLTGTLKYARFSNTLKILKLYNNKLSGNLGVITFPIEMVEIYLDNNLFTGYLSNNFSISARIISLGNNLLNGEICNMVYSKFLLTLDLSHNLLSGSLDTLMLPAGVMYVNLSHNRFSGDVYTKWPDKLNHLNLSYNQLTGLIPSFPANIFSRHLDFSHNNFTDSPDLHTLFLSTAFLRINDNQLKLQFKDDSLVSNNYSFLVPEETKKSHLRRLDLSYNHIIPPDFINIETGLDLIDHYLSNIFELAPFIDHLRMSGMNLVGNLSRRGLQSYSRNYEKRIVEIELLDLSNNHLSSISPIFFNIPNLDVRRNVHLTDREQIVLDPANCWERKNSISHALIPNINTYSPVNDFLECTYLCDSIAVDWTFNVGKLCRCRSGFYGASPKCSRCETNHFSIAGRNEKGCTACPSYSYIPDHIEQVALENCKCMDGYSITQSVVAPCTTPCDENYFLRYEESTGGVCQSCANSGGAFKCPAARFGYRYPNPGYWASYKYTETRSIVDHVIACPIPAACKGIMYNNLEVDVLTFGEAERLDSIQCVQGMRGYACSSCQDDPPYTTDFDGVTLCYPCSEYTYLLRIKILFLVLFNCFVIVILTASAEYIDAVHLGLARIFLDHAFLIQATFKNYSMIWRWPISWDGQVFSDLGSMNCILASLEIKSPIRALATNAIWGTFPILYMVLILFVGALAVILTNICYVTDVNKRRSGTVETDVSITEEIIGMRKHEIRRRKSEAAATEVQRQEDNKKSKRTRPEIIKIGESRRISVARSISTASEEIYKKKRLSYVIAIRCFGIWRVGLPWRSTNIEKIKMFISDSLRLLVVCLLLTYLRSLRESIAFFECDRVPSASIIDANNVSPRSRWRYDRDLFCDLTTSNKFSITSFPFWVVWAMCIFLLVILLPWSYTLAIMWGQRQKYWSVENRSTFFFIIWGYKPKFIAWQLWVESRKLICLILSVISVNESRPYFVWIILSCISIYLQRKRPFKYDVLNKHEMRSLIVWLISVLIFQFLIWRGNPGPLQIYFGSTIFHNKRISKMLSTCQKHFHIKSICPMSSRSYWKKLKKYLLMNQLRLLFVRQKFEKSKVHFCPQSQELSPIASSQNSRFSGNVSRQLRANGDSLCKIFHSKKKVLMTLFECTYTDAVLHQMLTRLPFQWMSERLDLIEYQNDSGENIRLKIRRRNSMVQCLLKKLGRLSAVDYGLVRECLTGELNSQLSGNNISAQNILSYIHDVAKDIDLMCDHKDSLRCEIITESFERRWKYEMHKLQLVETKEEFCETFVDRLRDEEHFKHSVTIDDLVESYSDFFEFPDDEKIAIYKILQSKWNPETKQFNKGQ